MLVFDGLMQKVFAGLAVLALPLAAAAQEPRRSYYTDFMYDNYVGDEGRRPAPLPGSMEYSLPRERRKPRNDTIGYVDVHAGLSQLGEYNIKEDSNGTIGGLRMDGSKNVGYGLRIGFDAVDSLVGVEIDFEGASQDNAGPRGDQPASLQMDFPAVAEETYNDINGEEQKTAAIAASPVLNGYKQDVKFFQGGLNLVLNLGGSAGRLNPFIGVGGGMARMRLANKGTVNTRTVEQVDSYACDTGSGSFSADDKGTCKAPGIWTPGTPYDCTGGSATGSEATSGDCSAAGGSWTPSTPDSCSIGVGIIDQNTCESQTIGGWSVKDTVASWNQSAMSFPGDEGANVGYARAVAGVALKVGPYANLLLSGSYTRYNDPGFSSMALESLTRTQGSLGLRMNF